MTEPPRAPLATALVGVIGVGVVAGAKGVWDIAKARAIAKDANARHEQALARLEAVRKPVHDRVAEYGSQQLSVVSEVNGRFADWIEHNQMAVNRLGYEYVDGLDIAVTELPEMKSEVKQAKGWIKGGSAGLSAAAIAPQAALMGISAFASASTGIPISSLSGAAAANATMAWLGGGSLAAGGGGMAAGAVVLNLIAAAPGAFIGGLTVAVIGSKQKIRAKEYAAQVRIACGNVQTAIELLPKMQERAEELSGVLTALADRAKQSIDILEGLSFDPDQHGPDFLRTLQLVRAIREVVNTPVLDLDTGELTPVSLQLVRKYQ